MAMGSWVGVFYRARVAAWYIAALFIAGPAMAGPPFRTDDPEPVEYQHYEFYTLSTGTRLQRETSGVLPAFEYNYGILPNAHFHIIVPAVAFDAATGTNTHFGPGDTELGLKYRFIDEDKNGWRPQVGTFPITILPTGQRAEGSGPVMFGSSFRFGYRKALLTGQPMAVVGTGSITAKAPVTKTIGSSDGCSSGRSPTS